MPTFEFEWAADLGGRSELETFGPVIWVEVSPPAELERAMIDAGMRVPPSEAGYALIDTGASLSAVDESVLRQLGITPINTIPSSSPHGNTTSSVYPAQIRFPTLSLPALPMAELVGCSLRWRDEEGADVPWVARDGNRVVMLLGRDLLAAMLLIYNGTASRITISI